MKSEPCVYIKNHVYKKALLASQREHTFENLGRYSCQIRYSHMQRIYRSHWLAPCDTPILHLSLLPKLLGSVWYSTASWPSFVARLHAKVLATCKKNSFTSICTKIILREIILHENLLDEKIANYGRSFYANHCSGVKSSCYDCTHIPQKRF